jgi:iron complex transport system substrate-binding protein
MKEKKKVLFVAFSVLLVLISLWTICGGSEITKWNSVTENDSGTFSVNISMDESKEVEFTVSSDLDYDWTWSVNEEEIKEAEGESSNLFYVFEEYSIYNVSIVGERENETTECAYWNVTVWLVIGEENDVRELEGLEDYTLRISKRPERIVSMAPSCTEILFAVGAGDSVVGVTSFCDYPREVVDKVNNGEIAVIGGYSTPSREKIVDLEPDLIFSAYGNRDDVIYWLIDEAEHPGIYPVYAQNPKSIEEIFFHIKVTGAITKCDEEASSLVHELRGRLEEIEERTELLEEEQRPRVYYAMGSLLTTTGKETFQHDVIELAGGKNIAAEYLSSWGQFNFESIIKENPQVIIYSSHGGESILPEQIKNDEKLKDVDAVKNNRIYPINENETSRPGPRIVNATQTVYGYLSEFFEEEEEEETIPPEITSQEPVDTQINNIEGESRTFAISIDQSVDIVWQLNGTEVQTDEDVTEASYTNASAVLGIWNVSAIATNRETGLSGIHTWVWNVTPAFTTTPTPVVNITATPSPMPSSSSTSKFAPAVALTPTPVPAQASTPKTEEKKESKADGAPVPGFEAVLAVVGLLAVMHLLRRKEK